MGNTTLNVYVLSIIWTIMILAIYISTRNFVVTSFVFMMSLMIWPYFFKSYDEEESDDEENFLKNYSGFEQYEGGKIK